MKFRFSFTLLFLIGFGWCGFINAQSFFTTGSKFKVVKNELCFASMGGLEISEVHKDSMYVKFDISNAAQHEGKFEGWVNIYSENTALYQKKNEMDRLEEMSLVISPNSKYIYVTTNNFSMWSGVKICYDGFYKRVE